MRAAKVDANQQEIVDAFRRLGCSVECLHAVGKGVPDLLIALKGVNILVEVKDGSKPKSARKLNEKQQKWHSAWLGRIEIAERIDDVGRIVRSLSDI